MDVQRNPRRWMFQVLAHNELFTRQMTPSQTEYNKLETLVIVKHRVFTVIDKQ